LIYENEIMKSLLFFLLLPFFSAAQTVHVEDNRIVYKGAVKLEATSQADVYARAKKVIPSHLNKNEIGENDKKETIVSEGMIRLQSPYHLIKTLHYTIELTAGDGEYRYRIDSVYLKQKERGGSTEKISSEELLKGMESTGLVAATTEKQLNEIDMNFQKLISLIVADMKRGLTK